MKKLICPNCGGRINPTTYRCEYCGTYFENDCIHRIETFINPVKTYEKIMVIPDEFASVAKYDDVGMIAIKELANALTDAIAENIEIHTAYDPRTMSTEVRGRIRIVDPNHRF